MAIRSHRPVETMTLRDVGRIGWLLVAATAGVAVALLVGAMTKVLFTPPWDILLASFSIALPLLALFTVWYLYDIAWAREIRRRRREAAPEVPEMATAEALLRLMDYSGGLLDRLTRYTGWFFFLILLAIFIVPSLFSLGLQGWLVGGLLPSLLLGGMNMVFWIAYFYFYYKIKHENDIWKERIARLRERERALLER